MKKSNPGDRPKQFDHRPTNPLSKEAKRQIEQAKRKAAEEKTSE